MTLMGDFFREFWERSSASAYRKAGLACLDFKACGNSTHGKFITLGCSEALQVRAAVNKLERMGRTVALWGRSMGGVSVLKSLGTAVNVVDSPFSSLRTLSKEFSIQAYPSLSCLIHCCFPCAFCCLNRGISNDTGYDLGSELNLLEEIEKIGAWQAVMFLAGSKDELIHWGHSLSMFQKIKAKKEMQVFEGTHNSQRPSGVIRRAMRFIDENWIRTP